MSTVHETSAVGFSLQTTAYDDTRPGYPPEVIRHVEQSLSPADKATILDLAAGTGKLTRQLLQVHNWDVKAAEPNKAMRAKFTQNFPTTEIVDGTAAELPFADGTFDAVFVGQAFHWFATEQALREIARVLKPAGGVLALIWNLEDPQEPWVADLQALYDRYSGGVSRYKSGQWKEVFSKPWVPSLFREMSPGSVLASTIFQHCLSTSKQDVWRRALSKSYISCMDQEQQARVRDEVFALIANYPDKFVPPTTGDSESGQRAPETAANADAEDMVGVLPLRTEVVLCFRK